MPKKLTTKQQFEKMQTQIDALQDGLFLARAEAQMLNERLERQGRKFVEVLALDTPTMHDIHKFLGKTEIAIAIRDHLMTEIQMRDDAMVPNAPCAIRLDGAACASILRSLKTIRAFAEATGHVACRPLY